MGSKANQKDFRFQAFVTDFPNFEQRDYLAGNVEIANITELFGAGTAYLGERDDTETAFRAQLDWLPDEDSLYYFSYNRGVQSGGFNAVIFPFTDPNLGYDDATLNYRPEQLDAFEVGFMSSCFELLRVPFNPYVVQDRCL